MSMNIAETRALKNHFRVYDQNVIFKLISFLFFLSMLSVEVSEVYGWYTIFAFSVHSP